ncbi:hypothetical protein D3C79_743050 [compost metagenome]
MLTQAIQSITHALDQYLELLGYQFDRHEQVGKGLQGGDAFLVAATVLLQDLVGGLKLIGNGTETLRRDDWIRTALGLFLFVVAFALFFVVRFFFRSRGLGAWNRHFFGRGGNVVVRVDVTAENIGQTATFGGDAVVFTEDVVNCAREVGNSAHHFTDAFLDTLGDFDFAFAGQELDRTHFAHVHAHRVGSATNVGLDRSQRCSGLFGCGFVGIGVGQHKGILIWRNLEYVDPHVIDHADDVFHLFRI